jgi:hypothetical protein
MQPNLEPEVEFELPSVISQIYTREQEGVKGLKEIHNRTPLHLPLELQQQGKILTAKEAIQSREPRCPLLTDAMAVEHEHFHEPQNLSFPHRCPFCWEEAKDKFKTAERLRVEKEERRREVEERRIRRRTDFEVAAEEAHCGHLNRGYVARSCALCQQMPEWHTKFGNPKRRSRNLASVTGEDTKASGGQEVSVVRSKGCSTLLYLGCWRPERVEFARWCGYQFMRGEANPYCRPVGLSEEVEKFIEGRMKERFAKAGITPMCDSI